MERDRVCMCVYVLCVSVCTYPLKEAGRAVWLEQRNKGGWEGTNSHTTTPLSQDRTTDSIVAVALCCFLLSLPPNPNNMIGQFALQYVLHLTILSNAACDWKAGSHEIGYSS